MKVTPALHFFLIPLAIFLLGSCAGEGSLTAPTDEANGQLTLQLENDKTGEIAILHDVLPMSAEPKEVGRTIVGAANELGWNFADREIARTLHDNGPRMCKDCGSGSGPCGSGRNCGPYSATCGSCCGSSASCYCTKVCP